MKTLDSGMVELYKIREENYKRRKDMTFEEYKNDIEKDAREAIKLMEELKNKPITIDNNNFINTEYSIFIYYDDIDKIYVASVPDLKGCMAHGYTRAEALSEIEAAISLHLKAMAKKNKSITA